MAVITNKTRNVLVTELGERTYDLPVAIRESAKARNISEFRVRLEMWRLARGRQQIDAMRYFHFGLHRPGVTSADRKTFLGKKPLEAINRAFASRGRRAITGIFDSKTLMTMVMERAGLPVPAILAMYQPKGIAVWPALRNRDDIARFLLAEATLPVFGKPLDGAHALGAISILERRADGEVLLGNGKAVSVDALVDDIVAVYQKGYLFQELIQPDPRLAALTGPVMASMRIVTLWEESGPKPLYAALKIPGVGAMVDDIASGVNGMAAVDLETGRIIRAQDGNRLGGDELEASPVTGTKLAGAEVPDFHEAVALAVKAHSLFPSQGIIGADITLSDKGLVIIELNANPSQAVYQRAHLKGILRPEFAERFRKALVARGVRDPLKALPLP